MHWLAGNVFLFESAGGMEMSKALKLKQWHLAIQKGWKLRPHLGDKVLLPPRYLDQEAHSIS